MSKAETNPAEFNSAESNSAAFNSAAFNIAGFNRTVTQKKQRLIALLSVFVLFAASCGSSGPDLAAIVGGIPGATTVSPSDVGIPAADASGDRVTNTWKINGSPAAVADVISKEAKPDERTDDAGGDVFLLYSSGTVWLSQGEQGTNAALYADNDKAYSRHGGVLIASSRWGTRVNNYRTSSNSSNSGNGFRGGGSSSGK